MARKLPKYLYHYTTWENAKSILQSKELKLGTFANANDWTEKVYRGNKKYLCFVGADTHEEGATISAMWSHYAKEYTGCCIVVDFEKFISKNNIDKKDRFWISNLSNDEIMDNSENAGEEGLLYKKTADWSYEKELRITGKCDAYSIDGCVEIVYIGNRGEENSADKVFDDYENALIKEWGARLTTKRNANGREDAAYIRKTIRETGTAKIKEEIIALARKLSQNKELILKAERENEDIMRQLNTLYSQLDNY